jgi:hypothetical protein
MVSILYPVVVASKRKAEQRTAFRLDQWPVRSPLTETGRVLGFSPRFALAVRRSNAVHRCRSSTRQDTAQC